MNTPTKICDTKSVHRLTKENVLDEIANPVPVQWYTGANVANLEEKRNLGNLEEKRIVEREVPRLFVTPCLVKQQR